MNARADAARAAGNWDGAAEHYRRLLDLKPRDSAIWVQLGHMHKEAGRLHDAQTAYLRAIELDPQAIDPRLQIAHLYKRMWRQDDAAAHFRGIVDRDPENEEAWRELNLLGQKPQVKSDELSQASDLSTATNALNVFDVTDLVSHIGHHDQLSGIQRVQCMILFALLQEGQIARDRIAFTEFDLARNGFRLVAFDAFFALLESIATSGKVELASSDREAARRGRLFPTGMLEEAIVGRPSVLILLGTGWDVPDYASHIANLKRRFGARFVMLFHDLVPIYLPETCNPSTAAACRAFLPQILGQMDLALCTSRNTHADLVRYCSETGLPQPPVCVTRLGSSFAEFAARNEAPGNGGEENPGPFVLMVGTVEPRKNHAYAFELWHCLKDRGIHVPRLVCVGRPGWGSEGLVHRLFADPFLAENVELLGNVDDKQLESLYRDCLFTLFPSRYEGWGLPVGESFSHSKLCVLPRIASLPEVAARQGTYIPLGDVKAAADIVAPLITDGAGRLAAEAQLSADFRPVSWTTVARTVADASLEALAIAGTPTLPELEPGKEYPFHALSHEPVGLEGHALVAAIEQIFTCPIGSQRSTSNEIATALAMRDSRWWPPDARGSCIKGTRASLAFAVAPEKGTQDADLEVQMLVDVAEGALPCALSISINGTLCGVAQVAEPAVLLGCKIPPAAFALDTRKVDERLEATLDLSVVPHRHDTNHQAPNATVFAAQNDMVSPLANGSALRLRSFVVRPGSKS